MPQELLAVVPCDYAEAREEVSYCPPRGRFGYCLEDLLRECPLPDEMRFGCYLIPSASRFSDLARVVECTVFEEFFGNTPEVMREAYAPYEEHSAFFLAVDREARRAAGALRVITHSQNGLKSLNDLAGAPLHIPVARAVAEHGIDLERCWDIGTLAVLKPYRGAATDHMVSTLLYGLFFAEARRRRVQHLVTILDSHAHAQLTGLMGVPFSPIAHSAPFSYLGSENSRACYGFVPDGVPVMEAYLRGLEPEMYRVLRPYLGRLLYCEGLPQLVEVVGVERTSTVRLTALAR